MLKINSMNMYFDGSSVANDEVIAHFTASYNGGPELYFNMNVSNIIAFTANSASVAADFEAFIKEVTEAAAGENIVPIVNKNFSAEE